MAEKKSIGTGTATTATGIATDHGVTAEAAAVATHATEGEVSQLRSMIETTVGRVVEIGAIATDTTTTTMTTTATGTDIVNADEEMTDTVLETDLPTTTETIEAMIDAAVETLTTVVIRHTSTVAIVSQIAMAEVSIASATVAAPVAAVAGLEALGIPQGAAGSANETTAVVAAREVGAAVLAEVIVETAASTIGLRTRLRPRRPEAGERRKRANMAPFVPAAGTRNDLASSKNVARPNAFDRSDMG